ncbi:hypothetical protein QCB45_03700 [Thiomicrorhabdus sp. ZW0627]|uniref:hypothetical protein n=1 Tax=Thiomicrorhabdus sp. ZW0627 TaxID=3039774 RepID=UPI002436D545|nr:hypothetical protein [Thiomicrorhabdus sp. ZW0627]MDG6773424.1 hypothetical protein [Thiomicrorhabdus sp. ZW0627]
MESSIARWKCKKLSVLAGIGLMAGTMFALSGCSSGGGDGIPETCNVPQEASLTTAVRIGGATSSVKTFSDAGTEWTVFNLANELKVTQVGTTKSAEYSIKVGGFIKDIELVTEGGNRYALLAMGDEGISVVNITDPTNLALTTSVKVNYEQTGITWTEGGGDIVPDNTISTTRAPISSLAVYDDGDINTPLELIIGDEGYGLHKTALSNLFDGVNGREADGTLKIDSEVYTLQYAGENPWGGPKSLTLFGSGTGQRLFVAQGYLGVGIYDPATLKKVGQYNLYTDETGNNGGEDWFINMKVSNEVQGTSYVDACTGMPNYSQANYEIQQVWHNKVDAPTPWADFDRYGKYYYDARKVAVQTYTGTGPDKTIAYIAYGLAGMVAIDVTGYENSGARDSVCSANLDNTKPFLEGTYLGYAPAVPAHGPDDPTGEESKSLFPYFGAGMLKEAGMVDVKVDAANNQVYFSDHFAGLMVMGNADNPSQWHGVKGAGAYNNDTDGTLGNHWPDYEFVTSYDMTPIPEGEEEIPTYIHESPVLLATGEVSGHGNSFTLTNAFDSSASGSVDVALTAGGGGLNFIDIDFSADPKYAVKVHFATTNEIGAAADGTATQEINIGHSEGVDAYGNLLFLADGPHGMSVWKIADDECNAIDDVHLVANTLQDEYPVTIGTETIQPTPHAYDAVVDSANKSVLVMSQSKGVRRVDTSVEGIVGSPVLLYPKPTDIFEHNTDGGNVAGLSMQDHAYGVALKGNLAFTADGSNGLTVYDLSKDPTYPASGYVVGNIGGDTVSQPPLGQASSVALWDDSEAGKSYAFVAAGSRGVGVVDVTDPANMSLIKVFEPKKVEDDSVGKADGKSVVVKLVGDYAIFTYDSFGVVEYRISDLIAPLPLGVTDPTKIWKKNNYDFRPDVTARFKLQDPTFFGSAELSELNGGSAGMDIVQVDGKTLVYVAYGDAGVIKIDWTIPTAPVLMQHINTVGSALDVVVINGRAYVADSGGGLTLIK